ncbi:high-affinity iron transporter [Fusarium heterosporum]|uniref:High-affinity iron transporter n=1 Tax=Fusarium heterosporum TaxID=42747 RepID=A0A8H5WNC7_FUSHE|nr:high-affinity iron transporter [Fusarium heterosporum]
MLDLFSVPVFVVVFRETLETAIIVSVLLAFLKQTLDGSQHDAVYKTLRTQVWLGTATGFAVCAIGSGVIIGIFYILGNDTWADHEYYYEGVFSLISAIIITIMGGALLRVGKMEDKWRAKLAKAIESPVATHGKRAWLVNFFEKYAMFALPFITVLREGIEGIVFVAGVSFSAPASAVPLPVIMGLTLGGLVGYALYRGGSSAKLQYFLVGSTCLLYLVAAGLFSRAIWLFEQQQWNKVVGGDAAELGDGPGSYDIDRSIWHVNLNGGGGWAILNAVVGWNNSATYGSVLAYNLYWVFVIAQFSAMAYKEDHGHWPLTKAKEEHTRND